MALAFSSLYMGHRLPMVAAFGHKTGCAVCG